MKNGRETIPLKAIRMGWLFIIILGLLSLLASCRSKSHKRVYSMFNSTGIQIDGALDDWRGVSSIRLDGKEAKSENKVVIKSQWDFDSLYLAFEVKDQNLQAFQTEQDHRSLYLDDMVEVLFDPDNHKDSCWDLNNIVYHINLLGNKKDDRGSKEGITNPLWNGIASYCVVLSGTLNDSTDIDIGYVVEFSIPWTELGVKPRKGLKIGINFANGDNDGNGRQLYDWVGAWPMRSPHVFGELILE